MTSLRWVATVLVGALMIGCTSSSSPGSEGPSQVGSNLTAPDPADTCRPIDIRSPTGERIDLTGTWEGGVFIHHVRQIGDCVWWIGYGRWPGTEPGELATLTFFGRLATDFTVAGVFATIVRPDSPAYYFPGPSSGSVAFDIGFDSETGAATTLTRVGAGRTDAEYPSEVLRLVGPLPDSANPPQQ
jgi:hypothetical protein